MSQELTASQKCRIDELILSEGRTPGNETMRQTLQKHLGLPDSDCEAVWDEIEARVVVFLSVHKRDYPGDIDPAGPNEPQIKFTFEKSLESALGENEKWKSANMGMQNAFEILKARCMRRIPPWLGIDPTLFKIHGKLPTRGVQQITGSASLREVYDELSLLLETRIKMRDGKEHMVDLVFNQGGRLINAAIGA